MTDLETQRIRDQMWQLPAIERMAGLAMTLMDMHQNDVDAAEQGFCAFVEMLAEHRSANRRGRTIERLRNLADRIERPMLTVVN